MFTLLLFAANVFAGPAETLLRSRCYECHGPDPSNDDVFVSEIGAYSGGDHFSKKYGFPWVDPGKPENSLLYLKALPLGTPLRAQKLPNDSRAMPKGGTPLTPPELKILADYIVSLGAGGGGQDPVSVSKIHDEDILQEAVLQDLQALKEKGEEARFFRYLSISGYENQAKLSQFVMNSLSWESKIEAPQVLPTKAGDLLRFDLRKYGTLWSNLRANQWDDILLVDYPYSPKSTATLKKIQSLSQSDHPYIRADWFVTHALVPPVYYDLLDLPQTISRLYDLMMKKRTSFAAEYFNHRADRAGFNNSGVSNQHRIIERMESDSGYFWQSYDFAAEELRPGQTASPEKNLFLSPLGPAAFFSPIFSDQVPVGVFGHDGGELIARMPNGLQLYYLGNGKGDRVDIAPTTIVYDKVRNKPIVAGISCMSCHFNEGILPKVDQIGPYFERIHQQGFIGERAFNEIKSVYTGKVNAEVEEDSHIYRVVMRGLGFDGSENPYLNQLYLYEGGVTKDQVLRELSVSEEEWNELTRGKILKLSPEIREFASNIERGSIERLYFEEVYEDVREFIDEQIQSRRNP